jgi:methionyl-tRNA formyltransferase
LFALKVIEKFAGSPFLKHLNVSLIGRSFSDSRGDRFCLDSLSGTYKCSLVTSGSQQSEILSLVQEFTPDVLFCLGWNYLLGQDVLEVARIASIGYHPSMLPQGRGRSPIIWAIVQGLPEKGSSFFELAPEPDAGGIITQERVLIAKDETSSSLYSKLIQIGYTQFTQIIEQFLGHGKIVPVSQEEFSATTWRKRDEKDGRIDFRMRALCIDRLVRALTWPYPNSTIPLEPDMGFLTVIESCLGTRAESMKLEPGRIIAIDNYWIHVKAGGDSTIWLKLAEDSATSNFLLSKSAKPRYFLPCAG